ncbi:MAG: glycosyltransferase family 4 protein [Elusimicrobiales bacterium]|nr:MAG: hypothetical protein A2Y21_09020 [Clostridiales bacterium GWC2_40_7]HCD38621.1 hypothetical protein [Candidatus Omnitrophota bacterium]
MTKTVLVNGCFLLQRISGVQRYAGELLSALARLPQDKYKLLLAVPGIKRNVFQEIPGVEMFFDGARVSPAVWTQINLPVLAKKMGVSAIWSPCNIGPVFPGRRHIVTVFDGSIYNDARWFDWKFKAYYKTIFSRYKSNVARVITCSNFSRGEIVKHLGIPQEKIDVVYAAIPRSFGATGGSSPIEGRYLLSLGSRDPRKNVGSLIAAWKRLPVSVKNGRRLVIAGGGNGTFAEEKLRPDTEDIVFTGYLPEESLPAFYSNAECFIYPSLYEGFGLPPLEAMACGCPVVVSRCASLPEVCGEGAYYVDPNSVDSIASGIRDVLTNSRLKEELASKGRLQAKKFDWDISAAKALQSFDRAFEQSAAWTL